MRLNCILVALWLWWRNRFRSGLGVRRSVGPRGLIPHFFHVQEDGDVLVVIDYIPRRRKARFTDDGDSFVVFRGLFRVRTYRLQAISTADTFAVAYREAHERSAANADRR